MIELTEQEVSDLDEITTDIAATEATLKSALDYCKSCRQEIRRKEKEWWSKVFEKHGLEKNVRYKTEDIDGKKCVVMADDACDG